MDRNEYNIYCDESCHLPNDGNKSMVLAATICNKSDYREITDRIKSIKLQHGLKGDFEVKWNKISDGKLNFYKDLIHYFFDNSGLNFRALVVPDKGLLRYDDFNHDHDTFYYKMYFDMLKVLFDPEHSYNIYLDIKDTRSQSKVVKLHDVLKNSNYDFQSKIIKKVQHIQSHEVAIMQFTDIFAGALSYIHRGLNTSTSKLALIKQIRDRSGYSLLKTTLLREEKFNLLIWEGGKRG